MRRTNKSKQSGGAIWLALALGAVFGMSVIHLGESEKNTEVRAGGIRSADEVVRFHDTFPLGVDDGVLKVRLLGTGENEITAVTSVLRTKENGHRSWQDSTYIRSSTSFEPIEIMINAEKIVVLNPESQWGSIHREFGLNIVASVTNR